MRPMDSAWKTQMAPPLALLVLGALTPRRHRVEIADENVERCRFNDSPDLVGITVKVDTAQRAFRIAGGYRSRGIPVVMGGIHATACPEDCMQHADAVVLGEAEELWGQVLCDAEKSALQSTYRSHGAADISTAPVPRWELLKHDRYLFTNTLTIGRGCPWRCDFCYNSSANVEAGYRIKPLANIMHEIESLNTDHVMFIDDNFIGNIPEVRKLISELARRGMTWHAAVSADIGRHPELVAEMAESGCRSLFIGFETVNANSLRVCGKRQNKVALYDRTIDLLHSHGIMVNASLVFGFDGDDESVFPRTLEWLVRNRVETMTAHILTPYPGTAFHRRLEREGRIIDRNLDHYNTAHVVFKPARMDPETLAEGYIGIYREFYSWPNILRRRPVARSQMLAYLQFNLVYRKYGKMTSRLGRMWGMRFVAETARRMAYPRRSRNGDLKVGAPVLDEL